VVLLFEFAQYRERFVGLIKITNHELLLHFAISATKVVAAAEPPFTNERSVYPTIITQLLASPMTRIGSIAMTRFENRKKVFASPEVSRFTSGDARFSHHQR
jgi:hypothetical protein